MPKPDLLVDNPALFWRETQLPKHIYYNMGCYEFYNDVGVQSRLSKEEFHLNRHPNISFELKWDVPLAALKKRSGSQLKGSVH